MDLRPLFQAKNRGKSRLNAGEQHVVDAICEATRGRGADVAIDCSGSPAGQNAALDAARKQGAVAFVGESRETTINPSP